MLLGWGTTNSGVFSAGNGPSMRSAVIGVHFKNEPALLEAFVRRSTVLTHTDPKAQTAALAIAKCAAFAASQHRIPSLEELDALLRPQADDEWKALTEEISTAIAEDKTPSEFAVAIGCRRKGVSGYSYQSVPVALFLWLHHQGEIEAAVRDAIQLGGDTDTVAAITGALCGASGEIGGIPSHWITDLIDWPINEGFLRQLATDLSSGDLAKRRPSLLQVLGRPVRNLCFLAIALFHGFARFRFFCANRSR